jgi:hypothetical protein
MRALLASALLLACTQTAHIADATPAPPGAPKPTAAVLPPLGDPGASPEDGSCKTEDELRVMLESFTLALNAGDAAALERSLSSVLWAVSASAPAEPHWVVYGRTEALRELLRRHAAGERWRLVGFSQTTLPGWDGASHFGVQMERAVAGRVVMHQGKGALFCHGRYVGIEVLGLGGS